MTFTTLFLIVGIFGPLTLLIVLGGYEGYHYIKNRLEK